MSAAAALVAALAAGCGGASTADESPQASRPAAAAAAPAQATTRAELVADAKQVCARMEKRFAALLRPGAPPGPDQLRGLVDAWAVTVDELRGLTPPPAERRRFGRMLAHFDRAIVASRGIETADGERAFVQVAAMAAAGMKGATIAHAYGLDSCSLFPPGISDAEFERYVLEQAKKSGGLFGPQPTLPKPKRP